MFWEEFLDINLDVFTSSQHALLHSLQTSDKSKGGHWTVFRLSVFSKRQGDKSSSSTCGLRRLWTFGSWVLGSSSLFILLGKHLRLKAYGQVSKEEVEA